MTIRVMIRSIVSMITLSSLMVGHAMAIEPSSYGYAQDEARRLALQAKYKDMPEVKLNRVKEDVKFQIVDMRKSLIEVNGSKFCAFRFRTADQVSQLTWCFRFPPGLRGWQILPETGRMEGFYNFHRFNLYNDKEGWGSKGDRFAAQSLPSRHFQPNAGYMIWFEIRNAADSAVNLSLNMTPVPDGATYSAVFPTITLADR